MTGAAPHRASLRCKLGMHVHVPGGGLYAYTCARCGRSLWQRGDYRAQALLADAAIARGDYHEAERIRARAHSAKLKLRTVGTLMAASKSVIGLARCSLGKLGLVLAHGNVTYADGTSAEAYYGRQLPRAWRRWSSRSPQWLASRQHHNQPDGDCGAAHD
jgi:hypothetical protein